MKNISQERLLEIERELNSLPIHIMVRKENGKMIANNTPREFYVEKGKEDYKMGKGIHNPEFIKNKNQKELSKKAVQTMREQGIGLFKYSEKRIEASRITAKREHTCPNCGRTIKGNGGVAHLNKCPYSDIPMNELRDTNISAYSLEKKYGVGRLMIGKWRKEML